MQRCIWNQMNRLGACFLKLGLKFLYTFFYADLFTKQCELILIIISSFLKFKFKQTCLDLQLSQKIIDLNQI